MNSLRSKVRSFAPSSSRWLIFWHKHKTLGVVLTAVFGFAVALAILPMLVVGPTGWVLAAALWGSLVGCHLLGAFKDAIAATDYATATRYHLREKSRL